MSSLTARVGLTEQENALVLRVSIGDPISVASLAAGYATEASAYQVLRRPHVVAALHREIQQALARDAPVSLRVLRKIRDDGKAPAKVRADISLHLMKMAGHVQPTTRDKEPEKALSDMTRDEMVAFIERNQAEIDRAYDVLAARAQPVSAQRVDQESTPTPDKLLSLLD